MEVLTELEKAVLYGTVEKASELCGQSEFTSRALEFACLYRGLDMVKALVECGAAFGEPGELEIVKINMMRIFYYRYSAKDIELHRVSIAGTRADAEMSGHTKGVKMLSVPERARVLDYLYDNSQKTGFDPVTLLYCSIRNGNEVFYGALKKRGVHFPENSTWIFKNACNFALGLDPQSFLTVFGMISRELGGEKIKGNMTFYHTYFDKIFSPESFEFILEHFDRKSMNQTQILKKLVDKDSARGLAIAEKEGWLKMPRRRDELIQYAADNGKTECTAWLLEYKNRTADPAAERAKAEKKAERELNADPCSVTELKKVWKYEKQENGTIIITGYKGDRTEVFVPEKIGKLPVTAIGKHAFTPMAPRLTEERALKRCNITKITVPPTVRTIGEYAFGGAFCTRQNTNAVSQIEEVILPDTLEIFADKTSVENAPKIFALCPKLTVKIPHSPYAELYCRRFNLNYVFG